MKHTIRNVRHEDWKKAKDLRLDALRDPVAHLAFLETYERAAAQPDDYWQSRAARSGEGISSRQFVAEAEDGSWLGSVSVLVELPGAEDVFGGAPELPQTHVVGVFVRPGARGTGLAGELFRAALDWSWSLTEPRIERVRLYVHEDNARAEALYRKAGFRRTGVTIPFPTDTTQIENELAVDRP
ncbi:GNAT family N-acetyltransferase [Streptacidiphilus sp. 4-A2]|nr:GNAT family N-acetyltransferase [Streptacidiphilus sp. 4-A2]